MILTLEEAVMTHQGCLKVIGWMGHDSLKQKHPLVGMPSAHSSPSVVFRRSLLVDAPVQHTWDTPIPQEGYPLTADLDSMCGTLETDAYMIRVFVEERHVRRTFIARVTNQAQLIIFIDPAMFTDINNVLDISVVLEGRLR